MLGALVTLEYFRLCRGENADLVDALDRDR